MAVLQTSDIRDTVVEGLGPMATKKAWRFAGVKADQESEGIHLPDAWRAQTLTCCDALNTHLLQPHDGRIGRA